jgi:hypothetical protein
MAEDGIAGGGSGAVYLRPTDGGDAIRLGAGEPSQLSTDGRWALTLTSLDAASRTLLPTGAGTPRPIAVREGKIVAARLLPDGRNALLRIALDDGGRRLVLEDIDSQAERTVLDGNYNLGPISPDGSRAAVYGDGAWHLLILDGSGRLTPIPAVTADDDVIRFDRSGEAIFVRRGSTRVSVRRVELDTGRATPLYTIGPELSAGVDSLNGLALSADGSSYCYSYMRDISDLYVVSGLR